MHVAACLVSKRVSLSAFSSTDLLTFTALKEIKSTPDTQISIDFHPIPNSSIAPIPSLKCKSITAIAANQQFHHQILRVDLPIYCLHCVCTSLSVLGLVFVFWSCAPLAELERLVRKCANSSKNVQTRNNKAFVHQSDKPWNSLDMIHILK